MHYERTLAAQWYAKAAAQGHAQAMHNLGTVYWKGDGMQQSKAEAIAWFARAAQRGHAEAARTLKEAAKSSEGWSVVVDGEEGS